MMTLPSPMRPVLAWPTIALKAAGTGTFDRICAFYVANWRQYGGDYIISRRRIWNPEVSPNWRPMGDRGGPTQNHEDHAHVSFEPTAPPSPTPGPAPDADPLRLSGQLVVIFEGD